jgi:hypothetical protein
LAYTIFDSAGSIVSAKISGGLGKSEVSQMQAMALDAIRRCGKISALVILEDFHAGSARRHPERPRPVRAA